MTFPKIIISFFVIVSATFHVAAQQREETVYKDSTIQVEAASENTIETPGGDEDIMTDEHSLDQAQSEADTVLRINHFLSSGDSVMALKNSKPFVYAKNLDSLLKKIQEKEAIQEELKPGAFAWLDKFFASKITLTVLWILAAAFVAFILYKLFFTSGFFQRPSAKNNINGLLADEDELLVAADYDKLIFQATGDKNYRLAVRYLYLQSLQKLATKGLIHFATDKTNHQYMNELSNKPYANDFSRLTLNYEYTWYGEFEIDEPGYLNILQAFKHFNNQL